MTSPFNVLNNDQPSNGNTPSFENQSETDECIKELIDSSPVFIFMKGTPKMPLCGFSQSVIQVFKRTDCDYKTFDVMSDSIIRQEIKSFSDWPTIPQVYINGEFIGGCDIIESMEETGELNQLLKTL